MYVIKGGIYLKKLLVYLKDYIKESILGPLFKLLEALFGFRWLCKQDTPRTIRSHSVALVLRA